MEDKEIQNSNKKNDADLSRFFAAEKRKLTEQEFDQKNELINFGRKKKIYQVILIIINFAVTLGIFAYLAFRPSSQSAPGGPQGQDHYDPPVNYPLKPGEEFRPPFP